MSQPRELTTHEAAAALGISERSVRRAIAHGTLRAEKPGSAYRIARAEVDRFAAGLRLSQPQRPLASVVAFPGVVEGAELPPAPLSSFIGRDQLVADVVTLVGDPAVRLVTLTGPGGIGKTRLAHAVAETVSTRFPDGVAFVALESVHRAEQVMPGIAQALGLGERTGQARTVQLQAFLRGKRFLLVLDNFEQVLDAAPLLAELLAAATGVTALMTSRAPLRISGERELPVPPLTQASERATVTELLASGAGRLFMERAQEHAAAFTLDDASASIVADICVRLDGLPLAIELAAARAKVLTPRQMRDRLERRLPLLSRGARNAPPRHGTMRDAIAWSYDLLTPEEQVFFQRLAVFVGGFTLEAAESVSGDGGRGSEANDGNAPQPSAIPPSDTLDLITALVDASLVNAEHDLYGTTRYQMLETIREFALERLWASGEEAVMRSRHAAAYVDFAAAYGLAGMLPGGDEALARLEAEHANLRLALAWLEEQGESRRFLRLAASLGRFWSAQGHYLEGRGWLERALRDAGNTEAPDRAKALVSLGVIQAYQGADQEAVAQLTEGVARCRAQGDAFHEATALIGLGALAVTQGDYSRGTALLEEAVTAAHAIPEPRLAGIMAGWGLVNLAVIPRVQGKYPLAAELLEAALRLERDAEFTAGMILVLGDLGDLARDQGNYPRAMGSYREALALGQENPGIQAVIYAIEGMGMVAATTGDVERGARLLGAAEVQRERIGLRYWVTENKAAVEQAVTATRVALGETAFATAWDAGQKLTAGQAVDMALEPSGLPVEASGVVLTAHETAILQLVAAGLTRRESEVLHRLAARQTDREIAESLFLSRRTVQWHVRSILAKLEATSRGEAVNRARARGLL